MSVIATATKTNFAAINDALTLDVTNLNSVRFEFVGTYNFTAVFEALGIDGVTWYPFQVAAVNSATLATQHSTANATQAYDGNCAMVTKVRVRLSAFTSAGTHSVGISAADVAVEPNPVVSLAAGSASVGTVVLGAGSAAVGTVATPSGSAISVTTTASTNASSQKASAGNLFELSVSNPTATAIYVKLYNKASAPTVGTDVPVLTIPVAAGVTVQPPLGNIGKRFTTGIAMAATAAAAATDTGVSVAGVQIHGSYI